MDTPTVSSTFLLTTLMLVGLVFFIRASAKDRTQVIRLNSTAVPESLHEQLKDYFVDRAYQVKAFEGENGVVTWEGMVQASRGFAVFLSFLAWVGLSCLALVLTIVLPQVGRLWFGLGLLAPLAGWFYLRQATRLEQVSYRIRPAEAGSLLSLSAHRDEILSLRQHLPFQAED
ncbi:MAG: cofactor assembly of complex C subunit B [Synechococcales cyanobacterium CRU_2_2]|nr:cofactor assembly of complex C subunit B [Synechococcales cyanobacterium CRU_2_2]